MRRPGRVGAIAALTWFAAAVLLDANQIVIGSPASHGEAASLDQGWGSKHDGEVVPPQPGYVFLPYSWFLALEQAAGDELFAASGHLERMGFLADSRGPENPDGLPVGFSRVFVDLPVESPRVGDADGRIIAVCV